MPAHHLLKHHCGWSSTPVDGLAREWVSPTRHRYLDPARSLTLPDELLTPMPPTIPTRSAAHQDRANHQPGRSESPAAARRAGGEPSLSESPGAAMPEPGVDERSRTLDRYPSDDDARDAADHPDWRAAEFGGAFPDTTQLKILHTVARQRIQPLREPPRADTAGTAERLAAIAALYEDVDSAPPTDHEEAINPDATTPNAAEVTAGESGTFDPEEPPF